MATQMVHLRIAAALLSAAKDLLFGVEADWQNFGYRICEVLMTATFKGRYEIMPPFGVVFADASDAMLFKLTL